MLKFLREFKIKDKIWQNDSITNLNLKNTKKS